MAAESTVSMNAKFRSGLARAPAVCELAIERGRAFSLVAVEKQGPARTMSALQTSAKPAELLRGCGNMTQVW